MKSFVKLAFILLVSGLFCNGEAGVSPKEKRMQMLNCIKNIEILNGFPTFLDNENVVLFECKSGFVPYGEMKATCKDGKWDTEPPKCIKKGCEQPKIPINGKSEEEFSGALMKFSCDSGYELIGTSIVTCNGKTWSDIPPRCKELPPQLIEKNGEVKKNPEL